MSWSGQAKGHGGGEMAKMSDDGYYDVAEKPKSERPFDSGIGERIPHPLEQAAKFAMIGADPERPVSSQLSRIEQDVKAGLEGQARLNGLVDGLRVLVSEAFRNVGERIDLYSGFPDALRQLTTQISLNHTAMLASIGINRLNIINGIGDRLAAIEAKLVSIERIVAQPTVTCSTSNYRTRTQRKASKKPPSKKAQRAKSLDSHHK